MRRWVIQWRRWTNQWGDWVGQYLHPTSRAGARRRGAGTGETLFVGWMHGTAVITLAQTLALAAGENCRLAALVLFGGPAPGRAQGFAAPRAKRTAARPRFFFRRVAPAM